MTPQDSQNQFVELWLPRVEMCLAAATIDSRDRDFIEWTCSLLANTRDGPHTTRSLIDLWERSGTCERAALDALATYKRLLVEILTDSRQVEPLTVALSAYLKAVADACRLQGIDDHKINNRLKQLKKGEILDVNS